MHPSVVAAVRDGGWRRLSVGRFEAVVALAAALDVVTTADILLNDRGEGNLLLTWLAGLDPRLAVAYFAVVTAIVVGICWLDLGWLSVVLGTTAILAYGTGGVHNVLVRATGWGPKTALPIPLSVQIHYVEPVLGTALGVALALYWFGDLPWREVAVYAGLIAADVLATFALW